MMYQERFSLYRDYFCMKTKLWILSLKLKLNTLGHLIFTMISFWMKSGSKKIQSKSPETPDIIFSKWVICLLVNIFFASLVPGGYLLYRSVPSSHKQHPI